MKKLILTFLTLNLFLNSCFSQIQENILGKWIIEEKENISSFNGDPNNLKNSIFFGAELWNKAVGKEFEFKDNGLTFTNIAETDISEIIKLTYVISKNKDKINFTATKLTDPSDTFEFFVELEIINDKTMYWTLDKLTKYKLKKIE